jgi:site-specific recombinase XerD
MRQVIGRFLRHLDAEKNASASTIDTYRYDLTKFDDNLAQRPRPYKRLSTVALRSRTSKAKWPIRSWAGLGCHKVVFQVCYIEQGF